MKELIYPQGKNFEANGKKYRIDTSVSYDRRLELKVCQLELAYSTTFKQLYENNDKIIAALNKVDFVSASVLAYNIKQGLKKIDEKDIPAAMKICTLFINQEDEDVRYYNEQKCNEKINDWQEAGIDSGFFLSIAAHSVSGYFNALKENTRDISASKAKEKESPSNT